MKNTNDELNHIDATELYDMLKTLNIKVIDIREPYEHEHISLEGTINVPMNNIVKNYSMYLKKDEVYYLLCHHGVRSFQLTHYLTQKGYNIVNIFGGWNAMKQLKEKRIG